MKKVFLIMLIAVILVMSFTACSQTQSIKPDKDNTQIAYKVTMDKNQLLELSSDDIAKCINKTLIDGISAVPSPIGEGDAVLTDSGRYVGQADSNFIEIKISGVPDEKSAKVFMLGVEVKQDFENLKLNTGDNIKFQYTLNDYNQCVISKIEKI